MKARYVSLAIILILINYIIFATLFTQLMETDFSLEHLTRTPVPTFTPAPAQPIIVIPTSTPAPIVPTPTATRVLQNAAEPVSEAAPPETQPEAPPPTRPELVAPGSVNVRAGPGINYGVIGTLNPNTRMPVVGRNNNASWWQIKISGEKTGWVANSVVQASHTEGVPLAEAAAAPAAPPPAAQPAAESSAPSPPQRPKYQYEPTGWFDDTNYGVTRFLGDITDVNGSPVNGVFVQASCGNFSTISYPSGPVGWGTLQESNDWPAGFYDITIDTKPVPCVWTLTVVETDDRKTVRARLSESVPVEVTQEKSVVTANWRKNW